MVKVFSGDNPSQLYFDALIALLLEGKEVTPRGKRVRELRPVVFEYTNPRNRVTFLRGRKINPFFQMAEALWILAGRSDVPWLLHFNKNMAQFSDDGKHFNAPYGERLRFWNRNNLTGFIFNPHDQLADIYETLQKDHDTRQAYVSIWNPLFDHGERVTKDRACNVGIDFKIRDGKLDIAVFNRSNDLNWGTFGANLCQFSTIQEVVAAWLGIEVGTYYQITDSLHIYLDDYGAKETRKILEAYGYQEGDVLDNFPPIKHFTFEDEPRIILNFDLFHRFVNGYFHNLDPLVMNDKNITDKESADYLFNVISSMTPDPYFRNTLLAMLAYRAHRLGNVELMIKALGAMKDSQWKVSCLYFLANKYRDNSDYKNLYSHYSDDIKEYIEH